MSFPYKRVLVVGATSGIGEALASRIVKEGSKVIVVGRRQEKLDQFVKEHGADKASSVAFDVSKLDEIPSLASKITKDFPDLDCVFLNSGIQRGLNFAEPDSVDLSTIDYEMRVNYHSFLALTKAFLPFLQAKKDKAALIYTTSGLALIPMVRCANYSASKAALHHFILCLREQLKPSGVKVVELFPPAVQTELHDEKNQPDIKDGGSIGMPLAEFTDEAYAGLAAGQEQVLVGFGKDSWEKFEKARQDAFHGMVKAMKQAHGV